MIYMNNQYLVKNLLNHVSMESLATILDTQKIFSEASQQDSVALFSWITEEAGDFFF